MEEILEAAILGDANENDIEYVLLENIIIDRDNNIERRGNFNLDEMMDKDVKINFRFERDDLPRLAQSLRIPETVQTNTGNRVPGLTALCITLRRLAYPNRLRDLSPLFGLSPQFLSQIITTTINIISTNCGQLLSNLNNLHWLNRRRLEYYAQAVRDKGGAIGNCWGFIDGTARQICRPSINREDYYSGHKRFHCLKYQSVICPDGIIVSLKGAYIGRRHDAGIFRESLSYNELEEKVVFGENIKYTLFGDQAYGLMELLLTPFRGRPEELQYHQQQFNLSMKNLRLAVEWGFQKVIAEFAFVDFSKNQKLLLQDLQTMYKVAVLLANCHTCLYGSQTATYFDIIPPTLEEYVRN